MKNLSGIVSVFLLIVLMHSCKKDDKKDDFPCIDGDGNLYNSVIIGIQIWMAENLKTTKYNDGTNIPLVIDNPAWSNLISGAYCWYNNDEAAYKPNYGAIYNWYTVNTGKLCPKGWHVPTDAEWTILIDYLGGESVAGGKLKEAGTTHWQSPNTPANNETGFTALPGCVRISDGWFDYIGFIGAWWTATESESDAAISRRMYCECPVVSAVTCSKNWGYSVRCIKN